MKKFFSLFCALAMVLSVTAAPKIQTVQLKQTAKQEKVLKQGAKHDLAKSVLTKKLAAKKTDATKNQVIGKKEADNVAKKAHNPATKAARAPQAKKAEQDITVGRIVFYNYGGGDIFYALVDKDETMRFDFDFLLEDTEAEDIELGHTYGIDDIDPDYSYCWDPTTYEDLFDYASVEFTKTLIEGDLAKIEAVVTDAEGNVYRLHYEEEPIVPGDYDFVATTATHKFYSGDNDVYYTLTDANKNSITFDIYVAQGLEDVELGKEYTLDDMWATYTKVTFDKVSADLVEVTFVKSIENETEKINAVATDEHGRIFHVSYSFKAPEAEKHETITGDITYTVEELTIFGYVYGYEHNFTAQDSENAISIDLSTDDGDIFAEWTEEAFSGSVFNAPTETPSDIYSGTITIAATEDGFKLTGAVLCMNNTEYTLNLTYTNPEPSREVNLTLEGMELGVYDEIGAWQLTGFNTDETQYVSLAAYADQVSGHYNAAALAGTYCYIYTDLEWDEEGNLTAGKKFNLLAADLNVVFNSEDSTIVVTGTYLGQNADDAEDVPLFNLNLSGRIPAPEVSDMTFEFTKSEEGITVTPSNNEDAWDWYVVSQQVFDYYGADGVAEAVFDEYGNQYAVKGEQLLTFEDDLGYYLKSSGTYYLVVWGAGENNVSTDAASFEFEHEAETSDLTFQFADGEDGITVTPSNNEDAWDWYIADAATIEEYGSAQALAEAVYNYYGNQYAVTGEQLISWNDVALYTEGAAGTFTLIVWGAGANNMTTEASVHEFEAEEQEGSPYDSAEAFEIEFADYELDDQYLAQYHVLGASAEDEDGNYIYIEFNLASGATELAAGTYQIAETGAAGTVTTGSVDQYIYGSFAGHLTASGQISIPFWLFAEGSVTVAEDETITVDALNTKGAAITVVLHKQHTAIDNTTVESTAAKFIENGQLFIEKSGKRYNVLGAVVK